MIAIVPTRDREPKKPVWPDDLKRIAGQVQLNFKQDYDSISLFHDMRRSCNSRSPTVRTCRRIKSLFKQANAIPRARAAIVSQGWI